MVLSSRRLAVPRGSLPTAGRYRRSSRAWYGVNPYRAQPSRRQGPDPGHESRRPAGTRAGTM